MLTVKLALLFVFHFPVICAADYKPEHFIITVHDSVLIGDTVNFIEGENGAIKCVYKNDTSIRVIWKQDAWTIVDGSVLSSQQVERSHAGQYTCVVRGYSRTIHVDILYPPKRARIEGPSSVLKNEPFNLTCSADSLPPPAYMWTEDPSYFAPRISKEPTVNISHLEGDEKWFYCIVQNTMIPTNGMPVQSVPVSVKHRVTVEVISQPQCYSRKSAGASEDSQSSDSGTVAAAVIGWIIAVVAIVVAAILYFRQIFYKGSIERYKRFDESKNLGSASSTSIATPAVPDRPLATINAHTPEAPVRPLVTINPQTSEVSNVSERPRMKTPPDCKSVHSYLELEAPGETNIEEEFHTASETDGEYEKVGNYNHNILDQRESGYVINSVQTTASPMKTMHLASDGYEIPKET